MTDTVRVSWLLDLLTEIPRRQWCTANCRACQGFPRVLRWNLERSRRYPANTKVLESGLLHEFSIEIEPIAARRSEKYPYPDGLDAVPTSPSLSNNIQVPINQLKSIDQFDIKVDYLIDSKNKAFVRYSFQRATVPNPGLYGPGLGIYGGPSNNGFDATGPSRNQSPGLNYNHIFSPTLITEVRAGGSS